MAGFAHVQQQRQAPRPSQADRDRASRGGAIGSSQDHIIPLELGGASRDEANLRPEAWPAAHLKDKDEDRLHSAVCAGTMTLDAARAEMAAYAAAEQGLPAGAVPATTTSQSTATPAVPQTGSTYYANCAAVRAAGKAPLHRGEPGYRSELDGDGDGVACE
jgi:hypothetical protein